jgi:starch-binding outer membrane protein, SusD/RagB family
MIMKTNKIIVALVTGLLLCNACERIEVEPKDWIKEDLVWDEQDENAALAGWFLNEIYAYLPGGFNRINNDFLDAASGDAIPSRNNTTITIYTNGQINVLNNPDQYWAASYAGIRRANIFLANIDRVPTVADRITNWKAEARFIRVMLYFELLKRYGGVPLIGDKIFTLEDDLQIPRNTFAECVDYIVDECNAIKDNLRAEAAITDNEWGRIPRGAAIALKCRVMLYAASPLFNGGGITSDPRIAPLTGYTANDPLRWQKVIDAAEELMGLNYYALQSGFANVFTTKKNTEIILARQAANSFVIETNNAPSGYGAPAASLGLTSPTQELVDAFLMTNGLRITDTGSGYSASTPYVNRDPRMVATVFHNGSQWLQRNVETFEGGKDKPGGNIVQTKTGYYLRKFMGNFATNTTYTNQSHNFPIFRFAEILLNYAEALNEVGRTADATTQVIAIRRRAGILAGGNNRYGVPVGVSQDEMRELIRNERRIELAFEEHRFWDIRRWKIAGNVLNGQLHGMQIIRNADATLSYTRVPVMKVVFEQRLYHIPLPYQETVKNLALIQNEGW